MTQSNPAVSSTYCQNTNLKSYSQEPSFIKHVKFITETALPFISLYKPAATPLAYGMAILGVVQNCESFSFDGHISEHLFVFGRSIASLIQIYFQYRALEIVFGISELCESAWQLYQNKDNNRLIHCLELLSTIVHFAIILEKNSLYGMAFSLAIQALLNCVQAYSASQKAQGDLSYEVPLRTIAKILMSFIRVLQCQQIVRQIYQNQREKFRVILDESDEENSIISASEVKKNTPRQNTLEKQEPTIKSAIDAPAIVADKPIVTECKTVAVSNTQDATEQKKEPSQEQLQKVSIQTIAPDIKGEAPPVNAAFSTTEPLKNQEPVEFLTKEQLEEIKNHPLRDLVKLIDEKGVILEDPTTHKKYDFGAYFHGFGKGLVHGANIRFQKKVAEDGSITTELTFKVNPYAVEEMKKRLESITLTLDQVKNIQKSFKSKEPKVAASLSEKMPLSLSRDNIKEFVTFSERSFSGTTPDNILVYEESSQQDNFPQPKKYDRAKIDLHKLLTREDTTSIRIEGIGLLSAKLKNAGGHSLVKVSINGEQDFEVFYRFLATFGLEDAIKPSTPSDLEKLKLSFLFRIFYPHKCYELQHDGNFLSRTAEDMKQQMIAMAPDMEHLIKEHNVKPVEILPGYVRYSTSSIDKKIAPLGVGALTHMIVDNDVIDGDQEFPTQLSKKALKRIANIFTHGLLSQEMLKAGNIVKKHKENFTGYPGSVYTQMIWNADVNDHKKIQKLGYSECGFARVYISLKALNRGSYQYNNDLYGSLEKRIYARRKNIFDFIKSFPYWIKHAMEGHEVMVPERIFPEEIMGMSVPTEAMQKQILDYFRAHKLLEVNALGQERIHGILAKDFIVSSETIPEGIINRCHESSLSPMPVEKKPIS